MGWRTFQKSIDIFLHIVQMFLDPLKTVFSFIRKQIRIKIMQKASEFFLGEHDFTSFSKMNPSIPDHVCNVKMSKFDIYDDRYVYTIRADRFLHNMVRRIVGSLVNIGHLQLEPSIVQEWLKQKKSKQTIIFPAPAQGLYLVDVLYPDCKIMY